MEIKVPIVTILGLGENCDKFKIQMELYKNLVRKHYKVTVVSSNELGALFGFHTIPEELYEKGSFIEKVYLFNRYIKQLEKVEKPDLFIIGCPGEIMPINKKYPGHLSELPLVICNAIQTDIGILSLYLYQEISQDLISELGELCKRKFDVPVKFITIARQEYIIDVEREKLEYRFFDRVTYAEEMKTLNAQSDNFLNVSNESDYEKLTQKILFRLSQNPNIL